MKPVRTLRVKVLPDGPTISTNGREAWALRSMIDAGPQGVTPINHPGPRWSGYVFNLRKMGLAIETRHEKHGGPFPGTHARYVLVSQVVVLEDSEQVAA